MNKVIFMSIGLIIPIFLDAAQHFLSVFHVHELARKARNAHDALLLSPNDLNRLNQSIYCCKIYRDALLSIPAGDKRFAALVALREQDRKMGYDLL